MYLADALWKQIVLPQIKTQWSPPWWFHGSNPDHSIQNFKALTIGHRACHNDLQGRTSDISDNLFFLCVKNNNNGPLFNLDLLKAKGLLMGSWI